MDIFCCRVRCLLVGSWPSARHDQAQWLGTDKARAARGRKKEVPGCHALLLQARGDWAWYKALDRHLNRRGMEDVPRPHIGHIGAAGVPDRARDQCQSSVLFACVFGRTHLHRFDGLGHDAGRDWKFVFDRVAGQGGTQVVFNFLCFVSLAGPGFFRAKSRSGRIAELWSSIKLHYKTFHTQSREMIRVRPEATQAACEGCGDPPLRASLFRSGDGLPQASGQRTASQCVDSSSSCSACT